jgi:hypothetical protein
MGELYTKNTKISITIKGDGSEIFDYNLPQPHNYYRRSDIYTIEYIINGFFHTNNSIAYLNDILARFTLSMNVIETKVSRSDATGIELSLFQNLKSIAKYKNYESVDIGQDNIFWSIKLYTEDLIKESGEGNLVAYSLLESFAFARFIDRAKDKSTLKAKVRSIWNWYNDRGWTIPQRYKRTLKEHLEETMATRSEHMRRVTKERAAANKAKVINAITGLYADEYKKKSGSWHFGRICEATNLSPNTVKKYIKEYENDDR